MPYREPPDEPPGAPEYQTLIRGTLLHRIHRSAFAANQFNERVSGNPFRGGRFDSVQGEYSYLYAGDNIAAAAVETLLRDVPMAEIGQPRVIPLAALNGKLLTVLRLERDLNFVNLSGPAAFALGQDSWLTSCDAQFYPHTRHWALAIRNWCPDAAGFRWRSRIDNDLYSYVIFGDRVTGDALVKDSASARLTSGRGRGLLQPALARYGFSLPI